MFLKNRAPAPVLQVVDEVCQDEVYSDARNDIRQDLMDRLQHLQSKLILRDGYIQILKNQLKEMPALFLSQIQQRLQPPPYKSM